MIKKGILIMKIFITIFLLFSVPSIFSQENKNCVDQIRKELNSIKKDKKKLHKVRFISNYLHGKEIEKLKSKENFYSGLLKGEKKYFKRAADLMCGIFKFKIVGEGNYNFTLGNRKGDCEKLALGLKLVCEHNKDSYRFDNFDEYALSEYYFCCETKKGRKESRCIKRWPKCN